MEEALRAAGLDCTVCADLKDLCRRISDEAGVALLTEEALAGDRESLVAEALQNQPSWSDLPLVLLALNHAAERPASYRASMNVSLVERPIRIRTLLSVIQAALRSRRHQYKVRDQLTERARQAVALRENEERLQFVLSAGRLGSWELDLDTGHLACSPLCRQHLGCPPDRDLSREDLFGAIHPDERERVEAALQRAIDERSSYDIEYRTVPDDGATHWVLVRGEITVDAEGVAHRLSGVSIDVTNRRRNEEALRESDRKKDDFLALLAHELRNPLAPIRNGLEVLRLSTDTTVRSRAQRTMERQLGHMVRLIDDLLDISRINRNKMELRPSRILLSDAVGAAVETARPTIDAAGHELHVDLPSVPVLLDADLTRLAQVFSNLLTNSARYTDRGGRIWLSAERHGDGRTVVIKVRDTGIGIPAEAMDHLFDMFSQVDRSMERSAGGLGIGLALVRGLVEMHGGVVLVKSDGPGHGSEFTVRLPCVAPVAVTATRISEGSPDHRLGAGRWILVVDDNRDSAETMAEMLRLFGNEVVVAHDGVEGIERAEAFRPEVILMDVGMPRLNGLEATRRIREQPWGRDVAIVAVTGWGQDGDRLLSQQAGCDGHLVKPASLDELAQLLETLERERLAPVSAGGASSPVG